MCGSTAKWPFGWNRSSCTRRLHQARHPWFGATHIIGATRSERVGQWASPRSSTSSASSRPFWRSKRMPGYLINPFKKQVNMHHVRNDFVFFFSVVSFYMWNLQSGTWKIQISQCEAFVVVFPSTSRPFSSWHFSVNATFSPIVFMTSCKYVFGSTRLFYLRLFLKLYKKTLC